ncbi:MAG: hypothetical protein JNL10_02485 [Verrucomicrobiales bacterium]|nr:hypothetical protein [Verrucomicrobiales bacterium]
MKLLGNCILSLLLLAMPLWLSPTASMSGSGWTTSNADSGSGACCRPAATNRCRAHCCVSAPESPSPRVPLQATPVAPEGKAPSTSALLFALWQLPAAPSRTSSGPPPAMAGAMAPRIPLFLRHATLLI